MRAPDVRVLLALAASAVGRVVHDVAEFGTLTSDAPVTVVLVTAALALAWSAWPRARGGVLVACAAWFGLNLVGAALTVLPLAFLPFAPAQTAGHYGAHAVYLTAQVSALGLVPWRASEHAE